MSRAHRSRGAGDEEPVDDRLGPSQRVSVVDARTLDEGDVVAIERMWLGAGGLTV
jgi:hypothetical protein